VDSMNGLGSAQPPHLFHVVTPEDGRRRTSEKSIAEQVRSRAIVCVLRANETAFKLRSVIC